MTAEKDKNGAVSGHIYTPQQMSYVLYFELAKDPSNKHHEGLLIAIDFLEQLPPGTLVRFDPVTFDIQLGSNKGSIKTG